MVVKFRTDWFSQERIVFLPGGDPVSRRLLRLRASSRRTIWSPSCAVSVLGILAVGMGIVIIGRGIDLSAVAIMAMSVAWYLQMLNTRNAPD